jgi:CRP-like cAMP-binding protein
MGKILENKPACLYCNARIHSVFNVLDNEEFEDLNKHKTCSSYKKGQYVFNEQGMPSGLFCINTGKIKLSTTGFDGKEQILSLAKEGEILGYRALISDERYHCSAVALED